MKALYSFEVLLDWIEGKLSSEQSQEITSQLVYAAQAQKDEIAWLERFYQASQTIQLATPPLRVRKVLTSRFEAYAEGRRAPTFLQRLKAMLTFDSGLQFATAGVRSATLMGQRRQLIFSTDIAEVALNILPQEQEPSVNLTGQLFFLALEEQEEEFILASIQLLQKETEVAMTNTDDYGEFAFSNLPMGEYEMIISSDQFEVLISPLSLST